MRRIWELYQRMIGEVWMTSGILGARGPRRVFSGHIVGRGGPFAPGRQAFNVGLFGEAVPAGCIG